MKYWLFKSEPSVWSWDDQVKAGTRGTHWNGVRNHLAKQQMMAMQVGDLGFFYHSNEGKEIVGVVERDRGCPKPVQAGACALDLGRVRCRSRCRPARLYQR